MRRYWPPPGSTADGDRQAGREAREAIDEPGGGGLGVGAVDAARP